MAVGCIDERLRTEHGEPDARAVGHRRRDQRAELHTVDVHRLRPPGTDRDRALEIGRCHGDRGSAKDDEPVAGAEAGPVAKRLDERRVERDGNGHRADEAFAREGHGLTGGGERGRMPDGETVDGGDANVARVLELVHERRQVTLRDLLLEDRRAGEPGRLALRAVESLLVGGDDCAEAGLETRVDPPRLTLAGDAREAPVGGRDRKQRKQQEVDDELDLEAAYCAIALHQRSPIRRSSQRMFKDPTPFADTSFE